MNKLQIAQLNSFQTTQLILENGILIWQGNIAFKDNVEEFNLSVAEVFKYKDMQVLDLGGARAYKAQTRKVMADKSIKIRSAVQNYASDADLIMLYKEINLMPSTLNYGDQQKVLSYAQRVETIARKNVVELEPYKVKVDDVDDYLAAISKFKNAIPLVDGVFKGRKTATKKLAAACKKTRDIVEQKLRKGATQFMETAPDFYSDLLNAFEIDKLPTHFTEFDMLMVNKATV